jgi:DNA-binding NarL/FixJ family response regulator
MPKKKRNTGDRAAKVLIVDDHPAIREALAIRIAREVDLEVCGEAADFADAVRLAEETHPDVAIIDLGLRSGSGIDLIKRLRSQHAQLMMIVWSMYSEELYAERALRAGARGYINKEQATGKIVEAIRRVLDGKIYLSPAMTEKLLVRHLVPGKRPNPWTIDTLSDRELDVFRLIGQGVKTAEIATRLHLSVKTIETYRDRIREKLDLTDGTQLSRCAVEWVLAHG